MADSKNQKEYRKRLLYESSSSLRKLEHLRMTDSSVATVLSLHFMDDETTFEMTLINIIKLLCEEKKAIRDELFDILQQGFIL